MLFSYFFSYVFSFLEPHQAKLGATSLNAAAYANFLQFLKQDVSLNEKEKGVEATRKWTTLDDEASEAEEAEESDELEMDDNEWQTELKKFELKEIENLKKDEDFLNQDEEEIEKEFVSGADYEYSAVLERNALINARKDPDLAGLLKKSF